jgi:hypothetical protein
MPLALNSLLKVARPFSTVPSTVRTSAIVALHITSHHKALTWLMHECKVTEILKALTMLDNCLPASLPTSMQDSEDWIWASSSYPPPQWWIWEILWKTTVRWNASLIVERSMCIVASFEPSMTSSQKPALISQCASLEHMPTQLYKRGFSQCLAFLVHLHKRFAIGQSLEWLAMDSSILCW